MPFIAYLEKHFWWLFHLMMIPSHKLNLIVIMVVSESLQINVLFIFNLSLVCDANNKYSRVFVFRSGNSK